MGSISDWTEFLLAISGLVASLGGAAAAIIASIRGGKKDRAKARTNAEDAATLDENSEEPLDMADLKAIAAFMQKMQGGSAPKLPPDA